MNVSLSFEESVSSDVSIVVDVLRASTTMTIGFNNFNRIIPTFSPDIARSIAESEEGILVGERSGEKLDGFNIGNSPEGVLNYRSNKDVMVITTTNGTRILENMDSRVLIGSFVNARSVASASLNLASEHIDLVMAGRKGDFAVEDFLGCGEILYWIDKLDSSVNLSEYALSSILASRDEILSRKAILNSKSSKILHDLGYGGDVEFCMNRNISSNVPIYRKGSLELFDF